MRILKHPVTQFLLAGALALVLVVLATGQLSARAAQEEAIWDSRSTTEVLARSVAEPAVPRGLVDADPGAIDRFDRTVLRRLLVEDVERIKIWSADGRIVYSDETALIGERYALGDEEKAVLAEGAVEAEVSDLGRPENRFEVYYSAEDVALRQQEIFDSFRPITVAGIGVLLVLTTPLLWVLTRRLRRAAEERERLLRAAVNASDAERRRIARDLHDGVVQDLDDMSRSLRGSMRALRSLLVEIYPPDLAAEGLHGALDDLLAPVEAQGVAAHVTVCVRARAGYDGAAGGGGPMTERTIRVVVVDDHAVVRATPPQLLAAAPGIEVVGDAGDGEEAVSLVAATTPDVVLMDLQMPGTDGVAATRRITAAHPQTQVLVLTSFSDGERILSALDAGAVGYLLKDADPAEMVQGIHAVHGGQSPIHPRAARELLLARTRGPRGSQVAGSEVPGLTPPRA